MRMLEVVAAVALVSVAPWLMLVGWGPIRNLFEEHQDNEPWAYVAFGAPFWLAGILCLVGAAVLVMHARRNRGIDRD